MRVRALDVCPLALPLYDDGNDGRIRRCEDTDASGQGGRLLHILISVAIIGLVISEINQAVVRRRKSMEQLRLIQCRLNVELLLSLDKDNNGVDKLEFVIGMIVKLGLLSWSDVEPFMKQFDQLDTDGSGRLDRDDLVRCVSLTMDEIGRSAPRR